jgi:hypothetical protein
MPLPFWMLSRRTGAIGVALTAYDIWRRIPPAQRQQILAVTRKHGPRIAATAAATAVKTGRARAARAARTAKRSGP